MPQLAVTGEAERQPRETPEIVVVLVKSSE